MADTAGTDTAPQTDTAVQTDDPMFAAVEELAGPPGVAVQLDADYLVVSARSAS